VLSIPLPPHSVAQSPTWRLLPHELIKKYFIRLLAGLLGAGLRGAWTSSGARQARRYGADYEAMMDWVPQPRLARAADRHAVIVVAGTLGLSVAHARPLVDPVFGSIAFLAGGVSEHKRALHGAQSMANTPSRR
jgi:roadblock/LC7 domain-containing protein